MKRILLLVAALIAMLPMSAHARVETIMVHSPSIEGNLEGNDATRKVHVILPPSYDEDPERRFPVVYYLHGYTTTADAQIERIDPDAAVEAFDGLEMIVVIPDSYTKRGGSFYGSGETVGNFERFIAVDLVTAIDTQFRTIAERESRGLAGHSMGGYGTLRIGMKYPQNYAALYPMAPCCTQPRVWADTDVKYETMDPDTLTREQFFDFGYFAYAAAFSPNPENPPYFFDRNVKDGAIDPMVQARWMANSPAVMLPQYVDALKSYDGIALDVGEQDFLLAEVKAMDAQLTQYGIDHDFMLFEGDHVNRVKERFAANLLPFFAAHLDGESED
ncbi:alpha/beta hydrolase [Parerythrobacter aestuarii]|uniref:alpha/beta hydrolase n=1 Tax=Parerythrobacter aestuarii TaxID=3020909 RepID=UPI0024DEA17A|nr:alpha/beta hydrolase-fold protein [Parerythrobacter aestuarii]